jgi:parallel beta-helix repeat protein
MCPLDVSRETELSSVTWYSKGYNAIGGDIAVGLRMNRLVSWAMVITLLVNVFALAFFVQPARATGTIYIRADGSIDPPTAPIATIDNVTYTFTDNIYDGIMVQKSNIMIDGDGYTLQGSGSGSGFTLSEVSNVTVKETSIKGFYEGIVLGSNNIVYRNNIVNNNVGIDLGGDNDVIVGNNITANSDDGIGVSSSSNNSIVGNDIAANGEDGISFFYPIGEPSSSNNSILGNNITNNNRAGIVLGYSFYSTICGNNITNSAHEGILLQNSSSISIFENRIDYGGIDLSYSPNCSIWKNNVNYGGIHLFYSSYCNISENIIDYGGSIGLLYSSYANITRNSGGIVLSGSSFCIISGNSGAISLDLTSQNVISDNNVTGGIALSYSSFNVVVRNNITTQFLGVSCMKSLSNSFHHNNFVNNARPVFTDTSANFWDDGLEGNYWSNYNGTDSDRDGIGDAKYAIDMNNQDNYPLMGMFSDFNATLEHHVQTICNSSISDFQFSGTEISFSVTGENGTEGFCRLCIPTALMNATYKVFVNGTEVSYNLLPCSNETYSYLYFNYTHSTQEVIIILEFPSFLILPLFMLATLAAAVAWKRKRLKFS